MYILMVEGKYKSYFSNDVFTTIVLVNYNVCNTGSYKGLVDACNSEPPVYTGTAPVGLTLRRANLSSVIKESIMQ